VSSVQIFLVDKSTRNTFPAHPPVFAIVTLLLSHFLWHSLHVAAFSGVTTVVGTTLWGTLSVKSRHAT
jgi:hypothetical protein